MIWILALTVVLGSAGLVAALSYRHAWRWGEIPIAPMRVGGGAYREAEIARSVPRRVPRRVQWAAGTGFVWAVVTFFVFAPAGSLLALGISDGTDGTLLNTGLVLLVCVSGFALSVFLFVAGTSLLRCRPRASARATAAAIWSWVHHAAVFGVMAILTFPHEMEWLVAVAIPCVVGAAQAALFFAASRVPAPAVIHDGRPIGDELEPL